MTYILDQISGLFSRASIEPLPLSTMVGNNPLYADVLRLDAIHPVLSGNKLYKLYGYLQALADQKEVRAGDEPGALVTPGGAHSNHLHAVAAAGKWLGLQTVGLVRAYEAQPMTPTLRDCRHWGMQLEFLDRKEYGLRYDEEWQTAQARKYQAWWVGEGGSGFNSRLGIELLAPLCEGYDEVWLAVGSGTTALALGSCLPDSTRLVGTNVVADHGERQRHWQQHMPHMPWTLLETEHMGRFAALDDQGKALIQEFDQLGLPLDPVYGVRLVRQFLEHGPISAGSKCLLIHGGGLQGRRGYGLGWPMVGHHEPAFDFPPAVSA